MALSRLTRSNLNFLLGLCIGLTVSLVMMSYTQMTQYKRRHAPEFHDSTEQFAYMAAGLRDSPDLHDPLLHDMLEGIHGDAGGKQIAKQVKFEDLHAHHDDDTVAKKMASKIRVLVWVMTGPQNLDTKAIHVRNTWGKRANKLLFMSSVRNDTFPTVGLNVSEGREHLTAKTMQAFRYIYLHHFDDADWFMKADDDTYVIVENLRYLLSDYNSAQPVYFGHVFKVIVKQGYASGGAGYVISKEALRRIATKGFQNASLCRKDGGAEDAEIGKCLMRLGVRLLPSVDRLGRSRFHCFGPEYHLQGGYPDWYLKYDANGAKKGIDNISDYPITFHYMPAQKMYAMEYFVYHLRPFGIISQSQTLNLESKGIGT